MQPLQLLTGDPETFKQEVWGRRLHVHHTDAEPLASLFPLADADALITSGAMRTPQLRLAKDGHVLPEASYTRKASIAGQPMTGLIDARKVLAAFADGTTIVFQGLQRSYEPLRQLARGLEQELGHPVQVNAYLTPPGAQGFAVHADTHDVFTFQTHGVKTWELHDEDTDGTDRVQVLDLTPGTVFYLPTGTRHAARTRDETSLHVTVGINQLTWSGVLKDVVAEVLADGFGQHLPAGVYDDPDALATALRARLDELADRLRCVDAGAAAARLEDDFATSRLPVLAGGLLDLVGLPHLDAHTRVRRRPGSQADGRVVGERYELRLGDRRLTIPLRARGAADALLFGEASCAADLDWDVDSSLVVVRRLVREGALEIVR